MNTLPLEPTTAWRWRNFSQQSLMPSHKTIHGPWSHHDDNLMIPDTLLVFKDGSCLAIFSPEKPGEHVHGEPYDTIEAFFEAYNITYKGDTNATT